jgi:hypothetical protein
MSFVSYHGMDLEEEAARLFTLAGAGATYGV